MDNEHYHLDKFGKGLTSRQMEKESFVTIKKLLTILLAISFVVVLTLAAATSMGMKSPNYEKGFESGYKTSYQDAFAGNFYNVKAGLDQDNEYNDGYQHGYDEGYPAGQIDRNEKTKEQLKSQNYTS